MAANEIGFDVIQEIMVRSDVEDVIRFKSVCKSLYSLISTPSFVKSHLKHAFKKDSRELNTKRIIINGYGIRYSELFWKNKLCIVGSSNGLVCISPKDFELLIVNPCTRQTMEILEPPPKPLTESDCRWPMIWGFGYNSSNDDYKIVVGFVTVQSTRFYVFSLKSCRWKFSQEIEFLRMIRSNNVSGCLSCDGALHWFMWNIQKQKAVILSFDLSREEITETQQPNHPLYGYDFFLDKLGVVKGCLCIYNVKYQSKLSWVYDHGKQSWLKFYKHEMKHIDDEVYFIKKVDYSLDDKPNLSNTWEYTDAPVFVPTLVSPMDCSSKSDSNDDVILKRESKRLRKKNRKRNAKVGSNDFSLSMPFDELSLRS